MTGNRVSNGPAISGAEWPPPSMPSPRRLKPEGTAAIWLTLFGVRFIAMLDGVRGPLDSVVDELAKRIRVLKATLGPDLRSYYRRCAPSVVRR